jgi:Tfp pilus assembly protein FimT
MTRLLSGWENGFTLIELVVAISGMFALLVLAVSPLNQYLDNSRLDAGTQTLVATLELARHAAIGRNQEMVVGFYPAIRYYELFQDTNKNGLRDGNESVTTSHQLPEGVAFDGTGLWGPPSGPTDRVGSAITFSANQVMFNPQGKIEGGLGTIYMQNRSGAARAVSFNMASRLKTYAWQKASATWR